MKKMMKFVKGRRKEDESDRRSVSSLGSRSSLAVSASASNIKAEQRSPSVASSKSKLRLFQSNWSLNRSEGDDHFSKLHQAASQGNVDKILKHVKKIDVNQVDDGGRTPIHIAAREGHLRAVAALLEHGADPNIQDNQGKTSLGGGVESGSRDVVECLLKSGAAVDVPDSCGETVVHAAVHTKTEDILGLLVRKGANPDIINYNGESALHLAVTGNDVESVDILLRGGAMVNIRSHHLVTPLMLAAGQANTHILSSLLEFGARVEDTDKDGHDSYFYANNKKKVLDILKEYDNSNEPVTHFPSKIEPPSNFEAEEENVPELLQENDEVDDVNTWNDSFVSDEEVEDVNTRLVKSKGMFDLSKFMIGSDNESLDNMTHSPRHEVLETGNNDREDALLKISEEQAEQNVDNKIEVVDSPVWSDNDLQSWQSNENLEKYDREESKENTIESPIKERASPKVFAKVSEPSFDDLKSEDSYLPVSFSKQNDLDSKEPLLKSSISPFSSPDHPALPVPRKRISLEASSLKELKPVTSPHLSKEFTNKFSEKIAKLEETIETEKQDVSDTEDTDSEYIDIDSDDDSEGNKEGIPVKDNVLSTLLLKERLKKSNLKKIVGKLKDHRKEQQNVIDQLISKNKILDIRLAENSQLLRSSRLEKEISEGNLKTVRCMKGNLTTNIEQENQMLKQRMKHLDELQISIDEKTAQIEHLQQKFNSNKVKSEEMQLNENIENMKKACEEEFERKMLEMTEKFQRKEDSLKEHYEQKIQDTKSEHNLEMERLQQIHVAQSDGKEKELKEIQSKLELETTKAKELLEKASMSQETEKSLAIIKLEKEDIEKELLEKEEKLENSLKEKTETVNSLKAQFSHMADTYERKLEKSQQENQSLQDKIVDLEGHHSKTLCEKDELISHLKKDLASITKSYEERLKLAQANAETEASELNSQIKEITKQNELLQQKLSDIKTELSHMDNLQKDLESKSQDESEKLIQGQNKTIEELRTANENLSQESKMKQIKLNTLLDDLEASRHKLSTLESEIKELNDQAISSIQEKSLSFENGRILKLEAQLQQKEELLSDAMDKYQFSQAKIDKMEEFTKSQKIRISDLEIFLAESEKEKEDLRQRIKSTEDDDTLKKCVEELKKQCQHETLKLEKEKDFNTRLQRTIEDMEKEIKDLKSSKSKESMMLQSQVQTLEEDLNTEHANLVSEQRRNSFLKKEVDEEKCSILKLKQEIESLSINLRKERSNLDEEERCRHELSESLEEERAKVEMFKNKLARETQDKKKQFILNERIKDLEGEVEYLSQEKAVLEERQSKHAKKISEINDILAENDDLKQNVIQKDRTIEELERQISAILKHGEVRMKRSLEKMRIEYELMARSSVSSKMRKMNEYLNERLKEQENIDLDKETASKGIQIDLEERLSNTSNELGHIKQRLKRSETELSSVKLQLDKKERLLRSEEYLRRQLESQMSKLTNQRICDRMLRGSADNIARHSLETPLMSPDLHWSRNK